MIEVTGFSSLKRHSYPEWVLRRELEVSVAEIAKIGVGYFGVFRLADVSFPSVSDSVTLLCRPSILLDARRRSRMPGTVASRRRQVSDSENQRFRRPVE